MLSLADLYVLIILIAPGFIGLAIFKRGVFYTPKLSEFETTICSLIISVVSLAIFRLFFRFESITELQTTLFTNANIFLLFGLAIIIGLSGYLFRLKEKTLINHELWKTLMEKSSTKVNSIVTVFTKDSSEIRGILYGSCDEKGERDIAIKQPTKIFRDKDGRAFKEISHGNIMLVKQHDISRIAFDEPIELRAKRKFLTFA